MIAVVSAAATMAGAGGSAFAQDATTTATDATSGEDTTTTTDVTTPKSGGGTSTSGGDGKSGGSSVRLKAESAAPGKVFFYGKNRATYRYTISGDRPRNMKIQLVNRRNWRVVKVIRKDDLEPGSHKVTWAGNNRHGKSRRRGRTSSASGPSAAPTWIAAARRATTAR